ncbi:MAG TPA: alpha/beta hydrolase [Micromonosporaceae bacterium]
MPQDPREVLTRPAPPPDLTVRYGEHPDHVADVWLPDSDGGARPGSGTGARPLVLFLHGGFWKAEYDRAHTAPLASDLAERGWPVASLEYRRVGQPGGGWRGTLDDVAQAVAAVPGLLAARVPGLDPARPVLAGHSAGGHLALWAAHRAAHSDSPPRGVLALAPVASLAEAYRRHLDDDAVVGLLGGDPSRVPDRYRQADPAALVPLGVPAVVLHGTEDVQVPLAVSERYVDAARSAGDPVQLTVLPGVEHFGLIDPRSSAWPAVLAALTRLG